MRLAVDVEKKIDNVHEVALLQVSGTARNVWEMPTRPSPPSIPYKDSPCEYTGPSQGQAD